MPAPDPSAKHPPKPRLALRVGVTGKRAIPETEVPRIRATMAAVFEALARLVAESATDHHAVLSGETPLLRIICGMAEGADQLAADIAIERFDREASDPRATVATRLAAVLPFPLKEFEKDFEHDPNKPKEESERSPEGLGQVVARFEETLRHQAVESVLELDDEVLRDASHPGDRNSAYANLRDVLLEHTDVLVAISDDVDGGAGGTVDVIRIAIRESVPVIKISTAKPDVYLMRAAEPDAAVQTPREDEKVELGAALPKKLVTAVRRVLEPPAESAALPGTHHAHEQFRGARGRLIAYLEEEWRVTPFSWVFKSLRNALTIDVEKGESFWRKSLAMFRRTRREYTIDDPDQCEASLWPADHDPLTRDGGAAVRRVLGRNYGWADALAVRYADVTRSSYIVIGFLGALAVLVGLLVLLAPHEHQGEVKVAALLIEGFLLLVAGLYLFRPAHHERWHQRMIEYRAIAEILRHQRFVYALGSADRLERTADRSWREPDAWVGWYVRAVLRELGVPSMRVSLDHRRKVLASFREKELIGRNGQIEYNRGVAKRFAMIDERLGRLVQDAFKFTVGTAFVGAILLSSLLALRWVFWPEATFARVSVDVLEGLLGLIMAFTPALIAAVHGIRFQMEFRNTAERAAATERELQQIADDLARSNAKEQPGRKYCLFFVRSANEAMSADLAGWSNVYRGKAPEPP